MAIRLFGRRIEIQRRPIILTDLKDSCEPLFRLTLAESLETFELFSIVSRVLR